VLLKTRPHDSFFAVGPRRLLAVAAYDYLQDSVSYLRDLYVSHNERTWRRIPVTTAPEDVAGMVFAPDGTLLIAEQIHHQLWRLPAGTTTFQRVFGGPRVDAIYDAGTSLWTSGRVLIAQTCKRTFAVSTDGNGWKTVTPVATMNEALADRLTKSANPGHSTPGW
jgi:hypothetical protein